MEEKNMFDIEVGDTRPVDDDIDFEEIQKLFADMRAEKAPIRSQSTAQATLENIDARTQPREKRPPQQISAKSQQTPAPKQTSRYEPKHLKEKEVRHQPPRSKTASGLQYGKVELRNEPKYDNMHVKNLTISEKMTKIIADACYKAFKKFQEKAEEIDDKVRTSVENTIVNAAVKTIDFFKKMDFNTGVTLLCCGVAGFAVFTMLHVNKMNEELLNSSFATEPTSQVGDIDTKNDITILNPAEHDFSNLSVILKTSTPNAINITSTASRELTNFGIENQRVSTDDEMLEAVQDIKAENPNAEIIVINVDGQANTGVDDVIITTNTDYSSARSADNLAFVIRENNERNYGIDTIIECGEPTINGGKVDSTTQAALLSAGHNDVVCCSVEASISTTNDEVLANSIATSIAEGVVRLGATEPEARYTDSITISSIGDEIEAVADSTGVTHVDFISNNLGIIENGIIAPNKAMVIGPTPETFDVRHTQVFNNLLTTNPNDVTYYTEYYTVSAGQTVTEIAGIVGVESDEIYVPSGDKNSIKVGEQVGYSVPSKIVVVENVNSMGAKTN